MNVNRQGQIKLSQLRALIAVAERGNFGEAALQLGLSQSAVSHAIATLEEMLGIVLISRGRHGAYMTPVGDRVLIYARQIMQSLDGMTKEANLAKGLRGGQVRIASFRSVATHILPEAIAQFRQRFPDIAVLLTDHEDLPEVEQTLREGRADIGFTYLPTSEDFEVWELLQDEFVALFPPTFKLKNKHLTWGELAHHPMIMPPETDPTMLQFYAHCLKFNCTLNVAYRVNTDSTIVSMVARGLGAAVLPRLSAEPIPVGVQVFSLPVPIYRVIGIAVLADALQVPAVFAFLDILKCKDLLTLKPIV
ncbi:MAG: LysR family transcriptional regulator [Tildeniella nuda ZEHNDER 1965/U140]|nr:LysR family transcriptional regulator [Tildeniella nuda ZEHNDER 1965/U140]